MLSAADRRRYARQVLLTEIGVAGQARLLQSAVASPMGEDADPRAVEVALDYLRRAGVGVDDRGVPIALPGSEALRALAGRPELYEAAAALSGAFAAVEAIKRTLGAGEPGALPSSLVLCEEPVP